MAGNESPRSADGDAQLDAIYSAFLARLEGEKRTEVLRTVEPQQSALAAVATRCEDEMDVCEQELQLAMQKLEEVQGKLSALESDEQDAPANPVTLEQAREEAKQASAAMETQMEHRATKANEHAEQTLQATRSLHDAQRDAIRSFGAPEQQRQLAEMEGVAALAASAVSPSSMSTAYEALQKDHADLVIRVGGSLSQLGIKVDANGVVTSAPGGLFDKDYTILGIDGQRFRSGLEDASGTHNIILRCKKADILLSLARAPPKLLKGKALKLMQVKITPGTQGFGIDLSEVNTIAGLVKGGKAEASDLRVGDVIVAADGVNLGAKRLVEALNKGKPSHIFTIIRPAAFSKQDKPDELTDSTSSTEAPKAASPSSIATAPSSTAPLTSTPSSATTTSSEPAPEEDSLRRSLAESLGRLQKSTEMLAGPSVRITRTTPADGTGVTVEWTPRSDGPKASYYHLQWKLAQDTEWTQTEASKSIKATLVTKGNLKKDGLYQFRVRACSQESGEWGVWSTPSVPVCPDGMDDALSTIQEEATVVSSVAPSVPGANAGSGLTMLAVQGMLADQRQALEKQAADAFKVMEDRLTEDLDNARDEVQLWKGKFTEAAGNSMQAVLDAKEDTRAEVLKELESQTRSAVAMKEEAAQSIELIREAQKLAAEAKAEMETYKARFEKLKSEAKEETDREAEMKLQGVMRNAALEIRDKVKAVEAMTEGHIKRAVEEALRVERAKAEVVRRDQKRELEESYEAQLQAMQNVVGASSSMRITEIQEKQEERILQAATLAADRAKEEAKKTEAMAVSLAVAAAIEETENKLIARQKMFEYQLSAQKRATQEQTASMHTDEAVNRLVKQAKEEALKTKDVAVREAVGRVEQKAAIEKQQMLEGIADKIRSSVRDREKELLAEQGLGLQKLAEAELREANKLVQHAGAVASQQFGIGNDDFEEDVLQATRPATLLDKDELLSVPVKKPYRPPKPGDMDEDEGPGLQHGTASKKANGDDEDMVAPPLEYIQMKARHALEEKALKARQEADEYFEAEIEEEKPGSRRIGRAKRDAEKESLRERQLKEAMETGAALAYEESARKAMDNKLNPLQHSDVLALLSKPEGDAHIEQISGDHPALKAALERVQSLEDKVRSLGGMASDGGALELDRGENKQRADQMATILKQGEEVGITEADREGIKDVMELLKRHQKRGKAMKKMLNDVDNRADTATQETADQVQHDIEREDDIIGELTDRLHDLVARDTNGALTKDETKLLRQLTEELKHQQEQAEMREVQITWLQAESRRARITALLEARAELENLHNEAMAYEDLTLPTPPIAAAEDAFSISVDWLPPDSGSAARFHLQWRIDGESKWTSSAASEHIKVPCCTKGHLRTGESYEFRVRAANASGVWGSWSQATEPTQPHVLLTSMPSRPQVLAKTKGRVEVCWQPPEGGKVASYELQWRRIDGRWDEPGCSMETTDEVITTPGLSLNEYYTFRVRASLSRFRGNQFTEFSPSSGPVHPVKDPNARKEPKSSKSKSKKSKQPAYDADASETVIMSELASAAKSFHPTAQAHVEAHLQQLSKKREEDKANLQMLEKRNSEISTKAREDKLNELVKIKRDVIKRAEPSVDSMEAAISGSIARSNTESWD